MSLETVPYERPYRKEELKSLSDSINQRYLENLLEKGVHIIENNVKILEYGASYLIECAVTAEEEITQAGPVAIPDTPDEELKEES